MPDNRTLVVGLGVTLGNAAQSAGPWIVGGLHESAGFDLRQASLMSSAELLAMGCVMASMSAVVHRLPKKAVLVGAMLLCLGAETATLLVHGFWPFVLTRCASGLGFGMVYSLASAVGAGSSQPERTFGTAGSITLLLGTMINPLLGFGLQEYGYRGVFLGINVLIFIFGVPLCLISFEQFKDREPPGLPSMARATALQKPVNRPAAVGVMLSMALMAAALTGIFVFTQQIAEKVGLSGTTLGAGMSAVSLVSASGGYLADAVARRVGSTWPLLLGLLLMGLVILGMTVISSATQFWITFTMLIMLFWFLYPFVFGLASAVDPTGRIASGTATAKIAFSAGGTALSGYMAAKFGLVSYGFAAILLCAASALVAFAAITNLRRQRLP